MPQNQYCHYRYFIFVWRTEAKKYTYSLYRVFHDFRVIIAGGDFLGICDQKSSYKHVSDFGRLRSYDRLKLRIEGNDY